MRAAALTLGLFAASVSAHFDINTPASRGDNGDTQANGPCGGKDTPSEKRAKWSLTGPNQLSFDAGHSEADTAVYIGIGNNPGEKQFNETLVPQFEQIGMGEFCWNDLRMPEGIWGAEEGANATIQVVQRGHDGGGLYNCIDVTLTNAQLKFEPCKNGTGVTAEPVDADEDPVDAPDHDHDDAADDAADDAGDDNNDNNDGGSGAGMVKAAGGVVMAGVLAAGAFLL